MTGSERPSPEPLLKKEASPAALGGENSGNALEASNALNSRVWGDPSRTLEGNSTKRSESVSGNSLEFFQNFFRKVPAVLGASPTAVLRIFLNFGRTKNVVVRIARPTSLAIWHRGRSHRRPNRNKSPNRRHFASLDHKKNMPIFRIAGQHRRIFARTFLLFLL